jgi:uncharacterized membrane protein
MRLSGPLARRALRWTFWTAMVALSALVAVNTVPYFSFAPGFAFLVERGELARATLWRACFYAHLLGGLVCLATGPVLMWNGLLRAPRVHRVLGRAYVMAVLGCSGPASLYLALRAHGGLAGKLGFLVLGLLWCATTARGVQLVLRGRIAAHRRWMIRSYALALSAVFFRILFVLLPLAGVDGETSYVVSLWASLVVSVVAGEVLARGPAAARPLATLQGTMP